MDLPRPSTFFDPRLSAGLVYSIPVTIYPIYPTQGGFFWFLGFSPMTLNICIEKVKAIFLDHQKAKFPIIISHLEREIFSVLCLHMKFDMQICRIILTEMLKVKPLMSAIDLVY